MLVAIGPGVSRLQDYTNQIEFNTINADQVQGDTEDVLKLTVHDPLAVAPIVPEDDIVLLDENDPAGWPTVNLLQNPSFEGTYGGGGFAPSWGAPTVAGFTPSKSATAKYGSAAQQFALNNVANGTFLYLAQNVTIPTDENGTPLRALPYYGSIWCNVTSAISGAVWNLNIEWWTTNFASQISVVSVPLPTAVTNGWQRVSISGLAPSSASCFKLSVTTTITNATNSGTILFDGAQLEYATFSNYLMTANYTVPLLNAGMAGTVGNAAVNNWSTDFGGNTGVTESVVSSPTYGQSNTAQQIVLNATPATSYASSIAQSNVAIIPNGNYSLTMIYQITQAFATGNARLAVNWYDINGNLLATSSVLGPTAEIVSTGWESLTLRLGPGTPNPTPAGAASWKVVAGYSNPGAAATGTLVIGSVIATPDMTNTPYLTAAQLNKYPTTYCDSTQQGCYVDTGYSGNAYRQFRVFGGYIRDAIADFTESPERYIDLTCVDYGILFAEAPANIIVRKQQDSAAIKAVCDAAAAQGYLVGVDYVTNVASISVIDAVTFSWKTLKDAMSQISSMTVAAWWVDYYKRLWYQPALAVSAPFALNNDNPDYVSTFPFEHFQYELDSTQSLTEPVIEGSTELSAPQTQTITSTADTLSGATATINSNIAPGVVAIPVPSGGTAFTAGLTIVIGAGTANAERATVTSGATATSIPLSGPTNNSHNSGDLVGQLILSNGASYTSLPITPALPRTISAGATLQIGPGNASGSFQQRVVVASSGAANGASSIPVVSFKATRDYAAGQAVAACGYIFNGGFPIVQVDTLQVATVGKVVGLASTNQYSQGYDALLDAQTASIFFNVPQTDGQAIFLQYRFNTPVLLRLHSPTAEAQTGSVRRKIHRHKSHKHINSQQSAIDKANAELTIGQKAKPLGKLWLRTPPCPTATTLRAGMAIPITLARAQLNATLFQIQKITLRSTGGNGKLVRECEIGHYRPDFMIKMAQQQRKMHEVESADLNASSILQDVLSASDGWTVTDQITTIVNNIGVWQAGATPVPPALADYGWGSETISVSGGPGPAGSSSMPSSSTWGGAYVWG